MNTQNQTQRENVGLLARVLLEKPTPKGKTARFELIKPEKIVEPKNEFTEMIEYLQRNTPIYMAG